MGYFCCDDCYWYIVHLLLDLYYILWILKMNLIQLSPRLQHFSSTSLALSILQLSCAHSTAPSLPSHRSCSFPVRLSVASPQLSLKASLMTSTRHQGPNASINIKLLKLFCQPSQRHQCMTLKIHNVTSCADPCLALGPLILATYLQYGQCILQMAA